jgi:hypothetical protein
MHFPVSLGFGSSFCLMRHMRVYTVTVTWKSSRSTREDPGGPDPETSAGEDPEFAFYGTGMVVMIIATGIAIVRWYVDSAPRRWCSDVPHSQSPRCDERCGPSD